MAFKYFIIVLIVAVIVFGSLLVLLKWDVSHKTTGPYFIPLQIGEKEIYAEVAISIEDRIKGLSGRADLSENQGMLFVYDKPDIYSFWMKDMNFPIDIIWIDQDYKIVDIAENISPDSFPQTFQPLKPAQYILEVNAGFSARNGIEIGNVAYFNYKN